MAYLRGCIDIQHKGVISGDHTPAPGAAPAPLVPHKMQEAAQQTLVRPCQRVFLKAERTVRRQSALKVSGDQIQPGNFTITTIFSV